MDRVIRLAHRGYSDKYKENTREAIEKAIGLFDGVEIDISLTKDGQFILMHDLTMNRTSSLVGQAKEFSVEEIISEDSSVYTLKGFLEEFGSTFKYVNIDIKNYSDPFDKVEEKLIKLMDDYDLSKTTYIMSSPSPEALNTIRTLTDKYKLALLISKPEQIDNIDKVKQLDYLSVLDTFDGIGEFDSNKLMVWSKDRKALYRNSKIIIEDAV